VILGQWQAKKDAEALAKAAAAGGEADVAMTEPVAEEAEAAVEAEAPQAEAEAAPVAEVVLVEETPKEE
ncbi:hypothetical protein KIPB_010008, partial [Kipferlia bialata]